MKFPLAQAVTHAHESDVVASALDLVREHLNMDYSYLTEFSGDDVIFRSISHADDAGLVKPGDRMEQHLTFCASVADGTLPQIIQDTADYPLAQGIADTHGMPIRAHISVPVHRRDGRLYGMFCCFSRTPNKTLNKRDLDVATMFAGIVAHSLNDELEAVEVRTAMQDEIDQIILNDGLETFFQPIVSMHDGRTMAFEALTRFHKEPKKGPLWWFNKATKANRQAALEIKAIQTAIGFLPELPAPTYLSVNASPATMAAAEFGDLMQNVPPNRMFIELTEHEEVAETKDLMRIMAELRRRKIGIAVDDVGAGYSGLSTIVRLRPNVLKLDRYLVDGIHKDKAKQSLTSALLEFSSKMNAFLIAEGVETTADDLTLKALGTRLGQGYLYGRPAPAREHLDYFLKTKRATRQAS